MVLTAPSIDFEEKLRLAREIGLRARDRRRKYDEEASFPEENFAEIRAAGLHTMGVPVEYGGLGLWQRDSFVPFYRILEALAEGDSSTSQLVQIQTHASGIIAALGSPEQKAYYMAKVVNEGALVASVGS